VPFIGIQEAENQMPMNGLARLQVITWNIYIFSKYIQEKV
jgi:hypothetical protein